MRIFDCFMYFDEDLLLDVRLNYLDPYVDYFVIVESSFTHSGEKRDLKFNLEKFRKFKDKIIYKVYDEIPNKIEEILDKDDETTKTNKYIWNAIFRENGQRNFISEGLKSAERTCARDVGCDWYRWSENGSSRRASLVSPHVEHHQNDKHDTRDKWGHIHLRPRDN